MTEIPLPTNTTAEVLYNLLTQPEVSERQMDQNGFRARISELKTRHNLQILYTEKNFTNKFNQKRQYRAHYIPPESMEQAKEIYLRLNKSEPAALF